MHLTSFLCLVFVCHFWSSFMPFLYYIVFVCSVKHVLSFASAFYFPLLVWFVAGQSFNVFNTGTRVHALFWLHRPILPYVHRESVWSEGEAAHCRSCHVELRWARHSSRIISHPNSCPGAKSQRIAETWCNTCVILPFETSNSSLWAKSCLSSE